MCDRRMCDIGQKYPNGPFKTVGTIIQGHFTLIVLWSLSPVRLSLSSLAISCAGNSYTLSSCSVDVLDVFFVRVGSGVLVITPSVFIRLKLNFLHISIQK